MQDWPRKGTTCHFLDKPENQKMKCNQDHRFLRLSNATALLAAVLQTILRELMHQSQNM